MRINMFVDNKDHPLYEKAQSACAHGDYHDGGYCSYCNVILSVLVDAYEQGKEEKTMIAYALMIEGDFDYQTLLYIFKDKNNPLIQRYINMRSYSLGLYFYNKNCERHKKEITPLEEFVDFQKEKYYIEEVKVR